MMGLADRHRILDLFESLMSGDSTGVLEQFATLYGDGADPDQVLQDLLDLTHWLTRRKVVGAAADADAVSEEETNRGADLAERLAMSELGRAWQILFKGLEEVQAAPMGARATEMVLLRLVYAADLPTPSRLLPGGGDGPVRDANLVASADVPAKSMSAEMPAAQPPQRSSAPSATDEVMLPAGRNDASVESSGQGRQDVAAESGQAMPESFTALVTLVESRREPVLRSHLLHDVRLVSYVPGRMSLRLLKGAPNDLPGRLVRRLDLWTGRKWVIEAVESEDGAPTIIAQKEALAEAERESALEDLLVRAALETFPGARVTSVRPADGGHVGGADRGD
jgi:DNA polymerase-3 subunit gamma/tau